MRRRLQSLALMALLLAGCRGGPAFDPSSVEPVRASSLDLVCGPVSLQGRDLTALPDATSLGEEHVAALTAAEGPQQPGLLVPRWKVVTADDELIELLRLPDLDGSDGNEHNVVVVGRHPDSGAWVPYSAGPCEPTRRLPDGLGSGRIGLATRPTPQDMSLDLVVWEGNCASGQEATGRVVLLDVERADGEIRVLTGVVPLDGQQTCPSNPGTPFTVDLEAPVGDDVVVDALYVPGHVPQLGSPYDGDR